MLEQIEAWKKRFEEHLLMRGFSERTGEAYARDLGHLLRFLSERGLGQVSEVTKDSLEAYRTHVFYQTYRGKKIGMGAQSCKIKAVKAFFRFLTESDYLLMNPAKDLSLPKEPQVLPQHLLSEDEMEQLLQAPDIGTPLGLRNRTILELLYATALRNTELRNLDLDSVDLQRSEVFVARGKGNKSRRLPVGEEALVWVESYLLNTRPKLARSHSGKHLFLSWRGHQLDRCTLGIIVKQQAKACGLGKQVTPHVLRHACATHMLKRGANIRHLQMMLGHSGLNSTQRYLRIEISDLHRAVTKFHPRERGFAQE